MPTNEIDARACKVFSAIDDPLKEGNCDDDGERDDAVVYGSELAHMYIHIGIRFLYDGLMLLPVTGKTGGKTNKTVVSEIYDSDMMSAVQPNQLGSTHFRSGNFFRPWRQLTMMGSP